MLRLAAPPGTRCLQGSARPRGQTRISLCASGRPRIYSGCPCHPVAWPPPVLARTAAKPAERIPGGRIDASGSFRHHDLLQPGARMSMTLPDRSGPPATRHEPPCPGQDGLLLPHHLSARWRSARSLGGRSGELRGSAGGCFMRVRQLALPGLSVALEGTTRRKSSRRETPRLKRCELFIDPGELDRSYALSLPRKHLPSSRLALDPALSCRPLLRLSVCWILANPLVPPRRPKTSS